MYNATLSGIAAKISKSAVISNNRYFDIHNAAFKSFRPEGKIRRQVLLAHEITALLLEPGAPVPVTHNNLGEARAMLEALLERGYAVDVVSRQRTRFRPRKRYDILIAPRANLAALAEKLNPDCIRVAHLDTSHWLFNNAAVFARERDLAARRGVALDSHKFVSSNLAIETAHYATLLGNRDTYATYAFAGKPVFQVPNPAAALYPWFADKDFAACRNRFLWIGSAGLVHKGLDLVLEAFTRMPDCHLTVCGPISAEPRFETAFRKELYQTPNIRTLGWTDITSPAFLDVLKTTGAMVYPSCAEGSAGTVLNSMHAGLIPLVTPQSGVDIDPDFGMLLDAASVAAIERAVRALAARPAPEFAAMARRAWTVARATHTRERYREVFGAVIERIATEHPNPSFSGFIPLSVPEGQFQAIAPQAAPERPVEPLETPVETPVETLVERPPAPVVPVLRPVSPIEAPAERGPMPELALLGHSAIVMAHPDDEVLWASSILARVGKVVLCYEDIPLQPAISEGRRQILARFPLPNVDTLRLPEAPSYGRAAWPDPVETEYGLEVSRGRDSARAFIPERYQAGFADLKALLRQRLQGCRNVITHNPWGEYGHEDHVQVFRAVTALQREMGFAVWVTSYCSNLSLGLMQRNLGGLGQATPMLPTDRALAEALKALYIETGCWTWFDDYVWPEHEVFYSWPGDMVEKPVVEKPVAGRVHPLELIWRDPPPAPARHLGIRRQVRSATRLLTGLIS